MFTLIALRPLSLSLSFSLSLSHTPSSTYPASQPVSYTHTHTPSATSSQILQQVKSDHILARVALLCVPSGRRCRLRCRGDFLSVFALRQSQFKSLRVLKSQMIFPYLFSFSSIKQTTVNKCSLLKLVMLGFEPVCPR